MVTVGLAAHGFSWRGGQRASAGLVSVIMVVIIVSLGGSYGLSGQSRARAFAVPLSRTSAKNSENKEISTNMVAVWLTAHRLSG